MQRLAATLSILSQWLVLPGHFAVTVYRTADANIPKNRGERFLGAYTDRSDAVRLKYGCMVLLIRNLTREVPHPKPLQPTVNALDRCLSIPRALCRKGTLCIRPSNIDLAVRTCPEPAIAIWTNGRVMGQAQHFKWSVLFP